jgi:hypothetical protein
MHKHTVVEEKWKITLPCQQINTTSWKEPSWMYDGHHIILVKHHGGGHP